ncbi:hypothetical protein [Sphingomonas sp. Mn802worker]|uniref:hypothetical protein n=1 Tax=Sphingomonas sp. Mn802worker TaxID=629773 RepID=UPI000362F27E|nr:hypothetical protein [Sphingomonas sp. Mn802worker]
MSKKTAPNDRNSKSKSVAVVAQPLTPTLEKQLSPVLGSEFSVEKLSGRGGQVTREAGVTRIVGRDYATSLETVSAAEIYFVNGSKPREEGPWLGEADKVSWIDPATGYECIVMRDDRGGFLSGFVGVPEGHPLFGWAHDAIPVGFGIQVHGGLSYSRICQDGPSPLRSLVDEARRVCHVVVEREPVRNATEHRAGEGHWWFGFDCNHLYDLVPKNPRDRDRFMGPETSAEYRDDAYVVREVLNLAMQLNAIATGKPVPRGRGRRCRPSALIPSGVDGENSRQASARGSSVGMVASRARWRVRGRERSYLEDRAGRLLAGTTRLLSRPLCP